MAKVKQICTIEWEVMNGEGPFTDEECKEIVEESLIDALEYATTNVVKFKKCVSVERVVEE